jgi:hypothetical protein
MIGWNAPIADAGGIKLGQQQSDPQQSSNHPDKLAVPFVTRGLLVVGFGSAARP